ncbi:putative short-chain dehydrogenase [Polychaeton citri CBS 116435]|uniref:Short-chain dehydrogenase n=1 Tax=Polychaeton citri CBS 116435 TaxID=1314669 RepID=A0A9P4UJ82_9PEZI|nr:putative short-chain dehydrogenase [Polychaeton citri CBS 116435]
MSLKGQTAFIAGGAKNLGGLIASTLAAEGANIAIHYHSASVTKTAESLAAELKQKYAGIKVELYQADLIQTSNVKQVFANILKDFGKLDIVINTVGMVLKKALAEVTEQEYDTMFAVNSKSAFFIDQEAAKTVSDGGKIINIVTALLAAYTPFYSVYQGSKSPVEWFTKGLSKELMSRRISVNAIAPGPMDTPFFYGQETDASVAYLKSVAIDGRLTKIEDIAPLVKFLVTDGSWITGQVLFASGGFVTR